MIRVQNLSKSFGDHHVLKDIDLHFAEGKTTVIIGPSGHGKSVFIKHLVGLLKPDSGDILVKGLKKPLNKMSDGELYEARKRFGMLFQEGALFDSMSVGENVAFPLKRHTKKDDAEIRRIVESKLEAVGMPGIRSQMPANLSGGMKKRVGLARAIVMEPQIVIFDEPTSGLDPVTAESIDELIMELKNTLGITFIVISHDIHSAFKIADNIGLLYEGRLVEFGSRRALAESENPVVRNFFKRNFQSPTKWIRKVT